MKLEIISGPPGSGKTRRLRAIELELVERGHNALWLQGGFSASRLQRMLLMAAGAGVTTVLIDDCGQDDLRHLRHALREFADREDVALTVFAVEMSI